jgi:glycosyltransferase involved in cell wall biosynthesis
MGKSVCILSSVHQASDTRVFHRQAKSLVDAGYGVTLIARHDRDETLDGVNIVALPKRKNRSRRMLGTWRVFRLAIRHKADVYHFHDPELIPTATLLKVLTGVKVIYDIHEDVPKQILTKEWLPSILRSPASKLYALIERFSLLVFDAIFVAGDDISQHLPRSKKIVTVRNYAPIETINQCPGTDKKNKDEPPTVIYIGELAVDRCIREIVGAIELLQGKAKLVLIGRFPDAQFEQEMRAGASTHIEFVEWVPYETVCSYLQKADIGVVLVRPSPNNYEASERNRKLYEYMAAGLPVIASALPSWNDLIQGNNCGLTVNALEPHEIARAVEYLVDHPEEAKIMGQNGRRAVLEKYNWETESKKLLAVYANLMEGV